MFSDEKQDVGAVRASSKRPKTPEYGLFAEKLDEKGKILTTRFTGLNKVSEKEKDGRKAVYRDRLRLNKQNNVYLVSVGKDNFKKVPSHSSLTLMANTFLNTFVIVAGTLQLYNLMINQSITFVEAYIKSKLLEELWIKENLPIIEKFKNLWVLRWDTLIRTKEFIERMDKYVKIAHKHIEIEMINKKEVSSFNTIIDKIDIKKKLGTYYNEIKEIKDIDSYQPFYKKYMEEITRSGMFHNIKVDGSIKSSSEEFFQRRKKRFSQNANPQSTGNNLSENNRTYLRQELIALTAFFSEFQYKLRKGYRELSLDCAQITNISYPGAANTVLESMIKITNIFRNSSRRNNKQLKWRTIRFKKVEISEAKYRHMRKIKEFEFYEQFLDTAFFELFPEKVISDPNMVIASYTAERLIRIK